MATRTMMTAEEFAHMSTAGFEDYELIDGELIRLPSATLRHNIIKDRSSRLAVNYFEQNHIGGAVTETDCRITSDTVRRPDVAIYVGEDWMLLDLDQLPLPFAPSIAVEVLSPSEHILAVNRKVRDYLDAGSKEVWLLDHENCELHVRTKTAIRFLQRDDVLDSPLLPGFTVKVADLLAGR